MKIVALTIVLRPSMRIVVHDNCFAVINESCICSRLKCFAAMFELVFRSLIILYNGLVTSTRHAIHPSSSSLSSLSYFRHFPVHHPVPIKKKNLSQQLCTALSSVNALLRRRRYSIHHLRRSWKRKMGMSACKLIFSTYCNKIKCVNQKMLTGVLFLWLKGCIFRKGEL